MWHVAREDFIPLMQAQVTLVIYGQMVPRCKLFLSNLLVHTGAKLPMNLAVRIETVSMSLFTQIPLPTLVLCKQLIREKRRFLKALLQVD